MTYKLRIDGIYDLRTMKHLKSNGLGDYGFDFSPKSFNFIQEHVLLEQLIPLVSSTDRLFFHFTRSNDPMVHKLIFDLQKMGIDKKQLFFEFDEWSTGHHPCDFEYNYLLNYSNDLDIAKSFGQNFSGFIFDFSFFEDLFHKNLIEKFTLNFFTRFNPYLTDQHHFVLKLNWNSNLISVLFDYFDFNLISMPINSNVEVCYRNVDLNKLAEEMKFFRRSKLLGTSF